MILILSFATESDREKFEFLYEKYKGLMLHKAFGILRNYTLAEDAVSDAYLRVYKNLDKIDDPASNRSIAFIATIVKNVSLTMLSKQNKAATELYDEEMADSSDIEEEVLSGLSSEYILAALGKLDEDSRGIFLLKFAHDMSHGEIAGILKISENNVTVKLHRAKKKISALLRKEGYAYGRE